MLRYYCSKMNNNFLKLLDIINIKCLLKHKKLINSEANSYLRINVLLSKWVMKGDIYAVDMVNKIGNSRLFSITKRHKNKCTDCGRRNSRNSLRRRT